MSTNYRFNVSSVQDFMQCRRRWAYKWYFNRVPVRDSKALTFGKMLHRVFEEYFTGMPMNDAIDLVIMEGHTQAVADIHSSYAVHEAIDSLRDLREPLNLWRDLWVWEVPVLEVEEPFVYDLGAGLEAQGRPDRVGVLGADGRIYHVQNRGLAAQMNFPLYIDLQRRSFHEHLYAEALFHKYRDRDYGGTFFNLVRKLKYRTNVGKKNEAVKSLDQMFYQQPMVIDVNSSEHKRVMDDLREWGREMSAMVVALNEGWLPPPNDKMNGGFNGCTEDPYFGVIVGRKDLFGPDFKDREDTYAPTEAADD